MTEKATHKESNEEKTPRKRNLPEKKKIDATTMPDEAGESIFAQLEKEVELGYREIDTTRGKVRIIHPTIEQESNLNDVRAKIKGKLTKDEDFLFEEELRRFLEKRGVWTEEDDKEGDRIIQRISNLYADIMIEKGQKKPNKKRIDKITEERNGLIDERNKWLEKRSKYFGNTIEYRIDEHMIVNKLAMCVTDTEGNKIWENVEVLNKERDRIFINAVLNEAMFFWAGWMPDFFERLQEEESGGTDTKSA